MTKSPYKLRIWHHILLCAALFACEISVTYELIYMVTLERLFGLPLPLVSLPGVISSSFSLFCVPFMGTFGDRGNRFWRKSLLVILSGLLQAGGAFLLLITCAIKLISEQDFHKVPFNNETDILNCTNVTYENHNTLLTETPVCDGHILNVTCVEGHSEDIFATPGPEKHNLSVINSTICGQPLDINPNENYMALAVVTMLSFVLMDIGFDTGSSNIRAFMLESVHSSWHSSVLSVGVLMSGCGGCVFGLLGLPNYSYLSPDGRSENLYRSIILSLFLMSAVFITVPITLLFGSFLRKKFKAEGDASDDVCKTADPADTENNLTAHDKAPAYDEKTSQINEDFAVKPTIFRRIVCKLSQFTAELRAFFKSFKNVCLALIGLMMFMAIGTTITFEVYFSNFLVEDIFHGDPDAPGGSLEKQRFDRGMRTASLGTVLFQLMFFLYNLIHKKVSDKIGLVPEYVLGCAIIFPVLVAVVISDDLIVFYVLALCNGVYRTLIFTTPFVLATEIVQEDSERQLLLGDDQLNKEARVNQASEAASDPSGDQAHGMTISLVYVTIPVCYLLLSATMGPLLAATGDASAPLMVGAGMGVGSALVLLGLLFVRKTWR